MKNLIYIALKIERGSKCNTNFKTEAKREVDIRNDITITKTHSNKERLALRIDKIQDPCEFYFLFFPGNNHNFSNSQ